MINHDFQIPVERGSNRIIEGNVQGGSIFDRFQHHTQQVPLNQLLFLSGLK